MELSAQRVLFPFAIALLTITTVGCNDDDNSKFPTQNGNLLVTKGELKASYMVEGFEEWMSIGSHDVTEMKYDGQGKLIEWISNGECAGKFTYSDGKILLEQDPDYGSIEFYLSPEGRVIKALYADGESDNLTYNEKDQCVEVKHRAGYSTLFHWADDQVSTIGYKGLEDPSTFYVTYTDIPKKSDAPYLRYLLLWSCGYRCEFEVSGIMNLSSDKYLPEKGVAVWADGYAHVFEATYKLDSDGIVESMNITFHNGWIPSSEETGAISPFNVNSSSLEDSSLLYEGEVLFSYMKQ